MYVDQEAPTRSISAGTFRLELMLQNVNGILAQIEPATFHPGHSGVTLLR